MDLRAGALAKIDGLDGIRLGIPTLLFDGRVSLLGNGFSQFVDVENGTVTAGKTAFSFPSAVYAITKLHDRRVLITGGGYADWGRSAFVGDRAANSYDPLLDQLLPIGAMNDQRAAHATAQLHDGRVLITGGYTWFRSGSATRYDYKTSAEVLDPATGAFRPVGRMTGHRARHTSTTLRDNRVLVAGISYTEPQWANTESLSSEIYDPRTETFSAGPPMVIRRSDHRAMLLSDGRVLIIGGSGRDAGAITRLEVFDPEMNRFTLAADVGVVRTATLLLSGHVLMCRVDDLAIYDAERDRIIETTPFPSGFVAASATLLRDGSAFILGRIAETTIALRYTPSRPRVRAVR